VGWWPHRLRHQCYLTPAGLAINGVTAALSSTALYHQGLLGARSRRWNGK
jgi:hypothetical protein